MSNQIVTVAVTVQAASTPSNLQQKGCLVSQGGTTLSEGSTIFLTQLSDLTSYLAPSAEIASISWATGTATVTTSTDLGIPTGTTVGVTISGCTPAGYNGTWEATATSVDTFTFSLTDNPGPTTVVGMAALQAETEILAMATTWFAQGSSTGVYVLELGNVAPATAVTNFSAFLVAHPLQYYVYVIPSYWDTIAAFKSLASNYTGTTAQTYFFAPVTSSTPTHYSGLKSVFAWYQSGAATGTTEWNGSAMAWQVCSAAPSPSAQVPPFSFRYLQGVTADVLSGANQTAYKAAHVNWVTTGAEGGISNTMQVWGTASDGNNFLFWYSVDWVQINANTALSAAIINGSNTTSNPLYYNQPGINRLQATAQSIMNTAIAYGLALTPIKVAAVPFATYVAQYPSDYSSGTYNGLSVTYTPTTGFQQITFNVTVLDFPIGV